MDAFRDGVVGASSDRFAGFEAKSSCHINVSDAAIVEEFYCVDDSGNGTVLEACLNYSIILVGGFEHFSTFPDIVRTGFFRRKRACRPDRPI